jgi:hypothetical protein
MLYAKNIEEDITLLVRLQLQLQRFSLKLTFHAENCDFEFECPLIFEDLFDKKIETNGEVLCNKCNKTVYEGT